MTTRTAALLEKIGSSPNGVLMSDLSKEEQRRARKLWRGVRDLLGMEDVFDMSWRLRVPEVCGERIKLDDLALELLAARRGGAQAA